MFLRVSQCPIDPTEQSAYVHDYKGCVDNILGRWSRQGLNLCREASRYMFFPICCSLWQDLIIPMELVRSIPLVRPSLTNGIGWLRILLGLLLAPGGTIQMRPPNSMLRRILTREYCVKTSIYFHKFSAIFSLFLFAYLNRHLIGVFFTFFPVLFIGRQKRG